MGWLNVRSDRSCSSAGNLLHDFQEIFIRHAHDNVSVFGGQMQKHGATAVPHHSTLLSPRTVDNDRCLFLFSMYAKNNNKRIVSSAQTKSENKTNLHENLSIRSRSWDTTQRINYRTLDENIKMGGRHENSWIDTTMFAEKANHHGMIETALVFFWKTQTKNISPKRRDDVKR